MPRTMVVHALLLIIAALIFAMGFFVAAIRRDVREIRDAIQASSEVGD